MAVLCVKWHHGRMTRSITQALGRGLRPSQSERAQGSHEWRLARRIMDKAWGDEATLPYMDMGRKWRRRFRMSAETEGPRRTAGAPAWTERPIMGTVFKEDVHQAAAGR